jgi:hypothetical protein
MIKKICGLILLALLSACGAPNDGIYADPEPDAVDELGQLEQPIYVPSGYGKYVNSEPCQSAQGCFVPDKKYIQAQFFASTCNNWWQTRMVTAFAEVEGYVDNLGDDWGMISPGSGLYVVRCGSVTGGDLGGFSPSDTQSHSSGLIQYNRGTIKINTAAVEGQSSWANATEAQRQRFAINLIKHEFGHLLGLPHEANTLLNNGALTLWWNANMSYTTSMRNRMQCYNEDSGTSPDC